MGLEDSGYEVAHWTSAQGLPQNQVHGICQTRDGYMWFTTQAGLARFDGFQFTVFDRNSTPPLTSDGTSHLIETKEGLWISAQEGAALWTNGEFRPWPAEAARADGGKFFRDSFGSVWWTGFHFGLLEYREGKFIDHARPQLFPDIARRAPKAIGEDANGVLWLGDNTTALRFDLKRRVALPSITFTNHLIGAIVGESNGVVWLGTRGTLLRWSDGEVTRYPLGRDTPVYEMLLEDSGDFLMGTGDGLLRFHRESATFTRVATNAIPAQPIFALVRDREGNIWCGTLINGVYRLRPNRVRMQKTGVHDDIWSLAPARGGGVWIGAKRSISLWEQGKLTHRYNRGNVIGLHEDRNETLWATDMGGLWKQWGNMEQVVTNLCAKQQPLGITEDRAGHIWISGHPGLCKFDGQQWWAYGPQDGLMTTHTFGVLETRDGTQWVGSRATGLFRREGGRYTQFTTNDGLPSMNAAPMLDDESGTLWIGTDRGLVGWKAGVFKTLTKSHGLPDTYITCIERDDFGYLWFGTVHGIFRVAQAQLHDCVAGKRARVDALFVGDAEGLASLEINGQSRQNSCKDGEGRLWFPTEHGAAVIDPKRFLKDLPAPLVILESVRANHEVVFAYDKRGATVTRIPPARGRLLEFNYTGIHFAAPEKLRFKYRLEGLDREWNDAGTRRVAYYANVPPGNYRFTVLAMESHGLWNTVGDTFAFVVQPFFYERRIFQIGCVALALAAAIGFHTYRLRVTRKLNQLEQQAVLARDRERIAQDMHDDLGSSLTEIALLSEVTRRTLSNATEADTQLARISRYAREAVDNISELVWATNPRHDTLESLCSYLREYTGRWLEGTSLELVAQFPEVVPAVKVPAQVRREIFLILKESLNNVRKHAHARRVTVALENVEQQVVLRVTDDGGGFDTNATPHRRGNGLRNIRDRVGRLQGRVRIQSSPGAGTTVEIRVPLS